jgi:hypothetical protein
MAHKYTQQIAMVRQAVNKVASQSYGDQFRNTLGSAWNTFNNSQFGSALQRTQNNLAGSMAAGNNTALQFARTPFGANNNIDTGTGNQLAGTGNFINSYFNPVAYGSRAIENLGNAKRNVVNRFSKGFQQTADENYSEGFRNMGQGLWEGTRDLGAGAAGAAVAYQSRFAPGAAMRYGLNASQLLPGTARDMLYNVMRPEGAAARPLNIADRWRRLNMQKAYQAARLGGLGNLMYGFRDSDLLSLHNSYNDRNISFNQGKKRIFDILSPKKFDKLTTATELAPKSFSEAWGKYVRGTAAKPISRLGKGKGALKALRYAPGWLKLPASILAFNMALGGSADKAPAPAPANPIPDLATGDGNSTVSQWADLLARLPSQLAGPSPAARSFANYY